MADTNDWTAEELVAELRHRERATVTAQQGAAGERSMARAAPLRSKDLSHLPTDELARMAKDKQRAIYGVDNRQDLYAVRSSQVRAAAGVVVGLVKRKDLTLEDDGSYSLATESYRHAYRLCSSEPFVGQPLGCFCTGFLVARDVIATAGHCVTSPENLAGVRFVFGFSMIDADNARTRFPADDVYSGKALLGRQQSRDGTDWALRRLDRPLVGRNPVKVRSSGKVAATQALFVIGHPCGLPQKYAPGAKVRDNSPGPYFVANLDTYGGNSGSPVFNAKTATVEGILVRGEKDFVTNGSCYVSLVCPSTGCRGEDVTRATVWSSKIPKKKKKR